MSSAGGPLNEIDVASEIKEIGLEVLIPEVSNAHRCLLAS